MQLVADRFAVRRGRTRVRSRDRRARALIVGSAGGVSEQLRWTERCDVLRALHHRAIAPLVDFGLSASVAVRSVACGGVARTRRRRRRRALLRACGLSATRTSRRRGMTARRATRRGHGYPSEPTRRRRRAAAIARACVIERRRRRAGGDVRTCAAPAARRRAVGSAGSGKRIVGASWRASRARRVRAGRVAADRLAYADAVARAQPVRHRRRRRRATRGRRLLDAALRDAAAARAAAGRRATECRRSTASRSSGCRPTRWWRGPSAVASAGRLERPVRRAAERAQGLPGRFVAAAVAATCAGVERRAGRARRAAAPVACRRAAGGVRRARTPIGDPLDAAPVAVRLAGARRAGGASPQDGRGRSRMLAQGRHAPGIRQLRQAIGGLARRGDWSDAAQRRAGPCRRSAAARARRATRSA